MEHVLDDLSALGEGKLPDLAPAIFGVVAIREPFIW